MAKRRKNRTHVPAVKATEKDGKPKSFVIKSGSAGQVGSSVGQLVKDVRRVMEPNTASQLRERRGNRLRDFIAMAGPLGVTHLLIFSQSEHDDPVEDSLDASTAVNLRICRTPRGPTLTFKVLRYSLTSDVVGASRRPRSPGNEYATEPLLILNNFTANEDRSLQLTAQFFQHLFPSLQVSTMRLTQARRVVLLSYDATTRTIQFRHYLVSVRSVGVSRTVRRIIEGGRPVVKQKGKGKVVPDMSQAQDVADFILGSAGNGGFVTSDSELESDPGEESGAEGGEDSKVVDLPQDFVGRSNRKGDQRAIRLTELGPRMELGLVKIEEGIGAGNVLFHEYIKKTKAETAALAKAKAEERAETAKRRKVQDANVKRKREAEEAELAVKKAKRLAKQVGENGEPPEEDGEESELDDFEVEKEVFGDEEVESDSEEDNPEGAGEDGEEQEGEAWSSESDEEVVARPPPRKRAK